jgi:hypothetical protein
MEERASSALYVEMVNNPPNEYAQRRREIGVLPGVIFSTLWTNLQPGRLDLPRTIADFAHVALYEVERDFAPPVDHDEAVACYLFVRSDRPAQGHLSAAATTGIGFVLISPSSAEDEQPLRDWADFIHIPTIVEACVPGYRMITPYRNIEGTSPLFLHLYEMETADPVATFMGSITQVERLLGGSFGTPTFDRWATHPSMQVDFVSVFGSTVDC